MRLHYHDVGSSMHRAYILAVFITGNCTLRTADKFGMPNLSFISFFLSSLLLFPFTMQHTAPNESYVCVPLYL